LAGQVAEQQRQLDKLRREQEHASQHRNGHARFPTPYAPPAPEQEALQPAEATYPAAAATSADDDDDIKPFVGLEGLP
jgi:hypothetical protein